MSSGFAMSDNPVFRHPLDADQLAEFQSWERGASSRPPARYQVLPTDAAFELRAADVLCRDPAYPQAPDLLKALDGTRTLGELLSRIPDSERGEFQSICQSLLGSVVTTPGTIGALQSRLAIEELVRFPQQSPYSMVRAYWENSIAIRQALPLLYRSVDSPQDFVAALCGFHRIATLGESGRNYYGSAGDLPTFPGQLRKFAVRTAIGEPLLRTLRQWLANCGVSGLLQSGAVFSRGGIPMTELAEGGIRCLHAYPGDGGSLLALLDEARLELTTALRAQADDAESFTAGCALFHQLIAAAHPFNNVNNSIAMNIVNDLLRTRGLGSLPHLFFDHVAQRMNPADYVALFRAALAAHAIPRDELAAGPVLKASAELFRMTALEHAVDSVRSHRLPGR